MVSMNTRLTGVTSQSNRNSKSLNIAHGGDGCPKPEFKPFLKIDLGKNFDKLA